MRQEGADMILELHGIDVDCVIGERQDERNRTQRLMANAAEMIKAAQMQREKLRAAEK